MTRPLVSALTPTHDAAAFVEETIESLLAQTYPHVEHVLVDDASSDVTPEILEAYAQRHPERIRVVRMSERAGPCRRRNDALALAEGSLIAWLDHDDVWLPRKIERQVEALERDPGAGFAYTQYETFDGETGETLERSELEPEGAVLAETFRRGCFFASSTAMIRREAMDRRGLHFRDAHFSYGDDYFLWLGLLLDWRLVRVDEVLTRIRRHGRQESARLGRQNYERWSVDLLEEFLAEFPEAVARLGPARRRGFARHWAAAAEWELVAGSKARAAAYSARAAALDPSGALRYTAQRARGIPRRLRRGLRR
jgi:glycosyltransferase involved in cell wall biosynthesis